MNPSFRDQGWEDRLRAGLGEPPRPEFEAWRARYADALAAPKPSPCPRWLAYRGSLVNRSRWIAAALVLSIAGSVAGLTLLNLGTSAGTEREVTDGIVNYYRQAAAEKYHRLRAHYFATHP